MLAFFSQFAVVDDFIISQRRCILNLTQIARYPIFALFYEKWLQVQLVAPIDVVFSFILLHGRLFLLLTDEFVDPRWVNAMMSCVSLVFIHLIFFDVMMLSMH